MTKSQVNRLGERLRKGSGSPTEQQLTDLQAVRGTYDEALTAAQDLLRSAGVEATGRLKTTNTIIEKLQRDRTRLSEMQDIAGLRVVQEMSLGEQNALVKRLAALFERTKRTDRRVRPSYGYRAVHVVARIEGKPVEIQVRTRLQDVWAQTMEKLADQLGREIRYGGGDKKPGGPLDLLTSLSESLAGNEEMLERIARMGRQPRPRSLASGQREAARSREQLHSLERQVKASCDRICGILEALRS